MEKEGTGWTCGSQAQPQTRRKLLPACVTWYCQTSMKDEHLRGPPHGQQGVERLCTYLRWLAGWLDWLSQGI